MALLPVLLDMVDDIYENLDNPENTMGDIPLLFVPHGRRRGRDCPRRMEQIDGECPRNKEHSDVEGHGHRHCHGGEKHGKHGHGHGEGHKHAHSHGEGHKHAHGHGQELGLGQEEKRDESHGRRHCRRKERRGAEKGHCRFAELRKGLFGMRGWENCPRFNGRGCPRFAGRGGCPSKKTLAEDFKVTFDVKSFNPEEISVKVKGREIFVDGKHDERADEQGFVSRQFTRRFIVPDEFDTDTIATYLDIEGRMTIVASKPKPPVDDSTERIIPIERVAKVQDEVVDLSESSDTDKMDEDTNDSKKN